MHNTPQGKQRAMGMFHFYPVYVYSAQPPHNRMCSIYLTIHIPGKMQHLRYMKTIPHPKFASNHRKTDTILLNIPGHIIQTLYWTTCGYLILVIGGLTIYVIYSRFAEHDLTKSIKLFLWLSESILQGDLVKL